jgi:HD superfamily phosphohydrolase
VPKQTYDPKKDPIDQLEALDRAQEVFLPVCGHVLVYPEEVAIIDHPAFQRLRRARQLGLAHMVFPGATHTRFEHSIGAVHVAQSIINHINHNFRKSNNSNKKPGDWVCTGINYATARSSGWAR